MEKATLNLNSVRHELHLRKISESTLKIIAMFSMLIDHIGAILLERCLIQNGIMQGVEQQNFQVLMETNVQIYNTYIFLKNYISYLLLFVSARIYT